MGEPDSDFRLQIQIQTSDSDFRFRFRIQSSDSEFRISDSEFQSFGFQIVSIPSPDSDCEYSLPQTEQNYTRHHKTNQTATD
jgi:hypothetical protein